MKIGPQIPPEKANLFFRTIFDRLRILFYLQVRKEHGLL